MAYIAAAIQEQEPLAFWFALGSFAVVLSVVTVVRLYIRRESIAPFRRTILRSSAVGDLGWEFIVFAHGALSHLSVERHL